MKMNAEKIIIKYKYILLSFLTMILFFLLFNFTPIREGFGLSDQYQYLAPDPSGNTWDTDTIQNFVKKYNEVNDLSGNTGLNADDFKPNSSFLMENATVAEAQYYAQNGKWPYCTYLTTNLIPSLQKMFPNRLVYAIGMSGFEQKITPLPLSYEIFAGTKLDPSSSSSSSSSSMFPMSQSSNPTISKLGSSLGF